MKMDNQGSVQVQNVIGWIIQNHLANDESSGKSKELMMNLVVQTEDVKFSIQRLHLLYGICEALENENEKVAKDFFVHLFPLPLRKNSASFINQLVSLAICLNTKQVLTATAMYIEKEQVKLSDEDLKRLSPDLAKCSPVFAAILIDRISSHFYTASIKSNSLSSTDLLTQWLVSLNDCNESEKITFNGQSLIRYSLIGQGSRNSDLHYNILNAIQKKRIQPLSNQFVIDIATQLSQKGDEQLCSKYAQILIMAVQNGLCNTLVSSNQMKNNLTALFPNNLLIKAIGGMKPSKS